MNTRAAHSVRSFARRVFALFSCALVTMASSPVYAHQHDGPRGAGWHRPEQKPNLVRVDDGVKLRGHKDGGRINLPQLRPIEFNRVSATIGRAPNAVRQAHNIHNDSRLAKQTLALNEFGRTNKLSQGQGVKFDLSSSTSNILLGSKLFHGAQSVTIEVGGEQKTIAAGASVTAAEYVAVQQKLGDGIQTIVIDTQGKARGGAFDLSSVTASGPNIRASQLVIPENVSTTGNFARNSEFKLTGALDNYGSIYALSSNREVKSGTISAAEITNERSGVITAVNSKTGSDNTIDLTLKAQHDLNNYGEISSSGSLSLEAGGTISNAGVVSSSNGDINLNAPQGADLSVNNTNGVLSAENGSINIREATYQGSNRSNITGGDLLSQQLNVYTGRGVADIDVNQLTGVVNQYGEASHVRATTDNLTLGKICLTGDPTYYNTTGSVTIAGDISVQETLAIVAAGDITSNGNAVHISAGDSSQGYPITMIAGASFSTSGGTDQPSIGPIPPANPNNGGVTITGASTSGGSIQLGSGSSINAQSTGMSGNSGRVILAAFEGSSAGSGTIDLAGSSINTFGVGGGNNGDVTLIAGSNTASTTIATGSINAGSSGTGGTVTLAAATPTISGGSLVIDAMGSITSGNLSPGTASSDGTVSVTGDIQAAGDLNFRANAVSIGNGIAAQSSNVVHFDEAASINNQGTVTSTLNTSQPSIIGHTSGNLELAGNGSFNTTNTSFVDFAAIGGTLSLLDDISFTGAGLRGDTAIDLAGDSSITATVRGFSFYTPLFRFSGDDSHIVSNSGVEFLPGAGSIIKIEAAAGSTNDITNPNYYTIFGQSADVPIEFGVINETGSAILNIYNGATTFINARNAQFKVGTGFTLNSSNGLIAETNQLTTSGTIHATTGNLFIHGVTNQDFILDGSNGTLIADQPSGTIQLSAVGNASLNINSSYTLNAGLLAFVTAQDHADANINFADNTTITLAGAGAEIASPFMNFGANTTIDGGVALQNAHFMGPSPTLHITTTGGSSTTITETAYINSPNIVFDSSDAQNTSFNVIGSVQMYNPGGTTTIGQHVTFSTGDFNDTTTNFVNNGVVTSTGLQSYMDFEPNVTFSGTGRFETTNDGAITLYAAAGNLNFANGSDLTFDSGSGLTTFRLNRFSGGSNSVALGNNAHVTVEGAGGLTLQDNHNFYMSDGSNLSLTASGADFNLSNDNAASGNTTITVSDNGTATVTTNGGNIDILPSQSQNISFSGTGSTLNLNGGPVRVSNPNFPGGGGLEIGSSFALATSGTLEISLSGTSLTNNGSITTGGVLTISEVGHLQNNGDITSTFATGGNAIVVQNSGSNHDLLLDGTDGSFTTTHPEAKTLVSMMGDNALTLGGSQTFTNASPGRTTFSVSDVNSSISIEGGADYDFDTSVSIFTPKLEFLGAGATLSSNGIGGTTVRSNGASTLHIVLADGTNTITDTGFGPTFGARDNVPISFELASGASNATLEIGTYPSNGAPAILPGAASLSVESGVTLSAGQGLNIVTTNLNNNGMISTLSNDLIVRSEGFGGGDLTLSGSGSFASTGSNGTIHFIADGNGSVLHVNSNYNLASNIQSYFFSQDTASSRIEFGSNTTQTVSSGLLEIASPTVQFGDNSTLLISGDVQITNAHFAGPSPDLNVILPGGSTATIASTTDRQVQFSSPNVYFQSSNGSLATLDVDGRIRTYSPVGTTSIGANVEISATGNITGDTTNLVNNGSLIATGSDASIEYSSFSPLMSLTGNGTYRTLNDSTGFISFRSLAGDLTLSGDSFTFDAGVSGQTSLRALGNLTDQPGTSTFSSYIALRSDSGDIGTSIASPFYTNAQNVSANAPSGSVYLSHPGTLILSGGSSSAGNTFYATAVVGAQVLDTLTAQDIDLSTTGGGSAFYFAAPVIGTNSLSIVQWGSFGNQDLSSTLIAPTQNIESTGGFIGFGPGAGLTLDAVNLTIRAAGPVYANDPNSVNLVQNSFGQSSSAGSTFYFNANGNLTVNSGIQAGDIALSSNTGAVNLGASLTATSGSIDVSAAAGSVATQVLTAATAISVLAGNNLSVSGSIIGAAGTVTLLSGTSGSSVLSIGNNISISASEGNLVIENDDTTSGAITIGANAVLAASSAGSDGNVYITIGPVPGSPVAGSAPSNTSVNLSNGGHVYFGANGITADPPVNTITADGGRVIFNTGSLLSSAINLGGNVQIDSQSAPQVQLLTSLDLTDSSVTSLILQLQSQGAVGGSLIVSGGIAIGGNAIFDPTDLASILTAENIPTSVVLTFDGFQNSNPLNIALTTSSTTNQVIIGGTHEFIGTTASDAILTITSDQPGPALVVTNSGSLSSNGTLAVTADSINNAGIIHSVGNLSLNTQSLSNQNSISSDAQVSISNVGHLTNTGTIASSFVGTGLGGGININTSNDLTIDGAGGLYSALDASISVFVSGSHAINFNDSATFTCSNNESMFPSVFIAANDFGSSFNFAPGAVLTANGVSLSIGAPSINFGAASGIISNSTAISAVNLTGGSAFNTLTVTLPENSNASITTTGGIVAFQGQLGGLNIVNSGGPSGGTSELIVTGPQFGTTFNGSGSVLVDEGTKISSNSYLTFHGLFDTIMTINGGLTTSRVDGAIGFDSNGSLTMAGSPAEFSITGGGFSFARFQAQGGGGVNITGSYTIDQGADGFVFIDSNNFPVNFEENSSLTVNGGANLLVRAETTTFGDNAQISVNRSTGTAITFDGNSFDEPMLLAVEDNASAFVSTSGGSINITPTSSFSTSSVEIGKLSGSGTSSLSLTGGAVSISAPLGPVTIGSGLSLIADNDVSVSANSNSLLVAGNLSTQSGSINLTAGAGTLEVGTGAQISANEGNLTIQNNDTVTGSIVIGQNASLSAETTGTTLGRVYLSIGPVPGSPITGFAPANVDVSLLNGGQVYFGSNGITADPPVNTVTADGGVVVFETGSLGSSAISLGGNVHINSTAAPFTPTLLTSLDLTDEDTVSLIVQLQTLGSVGGSLIVSGGIAIGGNAIFDPTDFGALLTAENIPTDVTVTFDGFQSSTPLNIALTGATSTTSQVIISGTHEYVGSSPSDAVINITSDQNSPYLLITGTGQLLSNGTFTVTSDSISNSGLVQAAGAVDIRTSHFTNDGIIQTTNGNGFINVHNDSGNLVANGNGTFSTNGSSTFTQIAASQDLAVNGSYTFNGNANAFFFGLNSNSSIEFAPNTVQTVSGGQLNVMATNLEFGADSTLVNNGTFAFESIFVGPTFSNSFNLILPEGSQANLFTAGASIAVGTNQNTVSIQNSGGIAGDTTTLSITGGNLATQFSGSQSLTMDSNTQIIANTDISFFGHNNAVMTLDGTIISSRANGLINVGGFGDITVQSNGGHFQTTGSGNPTIRFQTSFSGPLNVSGNFTFDPGASGAAVFSDFNGQGVNVGDNTDIHIAQGFFGFLTPLLYLGANSSVQSDSSLAGAIAFSNTPFDSQLNVLIAEGGQVTFSTAGGSIQIVPFNGGPAPISISSSGPGGATLNLLGAPVNVSTSGSVALGSGLTINSDNTISVSSNSTLDAFGSISAAAVSLQSGDSMAVNNVNASNGSISVVAGLGAIQILDSATLSATEGNLVIQNNDTVTGTIIIGQNASLSAETTGTTLGRVFLSIGPVPGSPVAGSAPANVSVNLLNGGQVYFGTNGIFADPPTNTVTADGGVIIFNGDPSTISLGGGVIINSTAAPSTPPQVLLTSLDLTDPNVTSLIKLMQQYGYIGGTLDVDMNTGIAIGGSAIIDPSDLSNILSAENIPELVSLYFEEFHASDSINIVLTDSSTTQFVAINGRHEYLGTMLNSGVLNVSNGLGFTAGYFLIGATGELNGSGDLTLNAANLPITYNSGLIKAENSVTVNTSFLSGLTTVDPNQITATNGDINISGVPGVSILHQHLNAGQDINITAPSNSGVGVINTSAVAGNNLNFDATNSGSIQSQFTNISIGNFLNITAGNADILTESGDFTLGTVSVASGNWLHLNTLDGSINVPTAINLPGVFVWLEAAESISTKSIDTSSADNVNRGINLSLHSLGISGTILVDGSLTSNGLGTSQGGSVQVGFEGGTFEVGNPTSLQGVTGTISVDGTAGGGTVSIANPLTAGSISVAAGAQITANGLTDGSGGSISLFSSSSSLIGGGSISLGTGSSLLAMGSGTGNGGLIFLDTNIGNQTTLESGSLVSAQATGQGSGGFVLIGNATFNPGSSAVADALGNGNGGGILIGANANVDSNVTISANAFGSGNGGVLVFGQNEPNSTLTLRSSVSADALGAGNGGTIDIYSDIIFAQPSAISANSATGLGGNISISGDLDLSVYVPTGSALTTTGTQNGTVNLLAPLSISMTADGNVVGTITANNAAFDVNIAINSGDLSLGFVQTALGNISATASGAVLVVGNQIAGFALPFEGRTGTVSIEANFGNLEVVSGVFIEAHEGNISLQNNDVTGGAILVNANLSTLGTTNGNIEMTASSGVINVHGDLNALGSIDLTTLVSATVNSNSVTGTLNATASDIDVVVNAGSLTSGILEASTGNIFVSASGGLAATGNIATHSGSITLIADTGTITFSGITVSANEGDLTVQNNQADGSIFLNNGAQLLASTTGTTLGRVTINIGPLGTEIDPQDVANVLVQETLGGQVELYGGTIVGTASTPQNLIRAEGDTLVMVNAGGGTITLDGLTVIKGHAAAIVPPQELLTSLDLTDPSVTDRIVLMQSYGYIGGTLQVIGGIAVGGNAIIDPTDLAPLLTAEYITPNTTLQFEHFDGNSINIELTPLSTNTVVRIHGTHMFDSTSSEGILNIITNLPGNALVIHNDGLLTAQHEVEVNAGAAIVLGGQVQATRAEFNTSNNGPITISGDVEGLNDARADFISLNANGLGTIFRSQGTLRAHEVHLRSGTGHIGTGSGNIFTEADVLEANTSGSGHVYINQNGAVEIGNSSAGNEFFVTGNSDITILDTALDSITANRVDIRSSAPTGTITINGMANVTTITTSYLEADRVLIFGTLSGGPGNIDVIADSQIRLNNAFVGVTNDGNIHLSTRLNQNGTIIVNTSTIDAGTTGQIDLLADGAIQLSGAELNISGTGRIDIKNRANSGSGINVSSDSVINAGTSRVEIFADNDLRLNGQLVSTGTGSSALKTLAGSGGELFIHGAIDTVDGNLDVISDALLFIDGAINSTGDGVITLKTTAGSNGQIQMQSFGSVQGNNGNIFITADQTITLLGQVLSVGDGNIQINSIAGSNANVAFGQNAVVSSNSGNIDISADERIDLSYAGPARTQINTASGDILIKTLNGSNGTITVDGDVSSVSGDVTIQVDGTGNILSTTSGTTKISAVAVKLVSETGHIGADAFSIANDTRAIYTTATNLDVSTSGGGVARVFETDGVILADSTSGGLFKLVTSGATVLNNIATDAGSIVVKNQQGSLSTAIGSVIYANEGDLTMQSSDTAAGTISIGKNSKLTAFTANQATGLGNVNIYIGTGSSPNQVAGPTPPNVTTTISGGGHIYFGANGITTTNPVNNLIAKASDLTFDTGSRPASAIFLGGNVKITADPPIVSSAGLLEENIRHQRASVNSADQSISMQNVDAPISETLSSTSAPLNSADTSLVLNTNQNVLNSQLPQIGSIQLASNNDTETNQMVGAENCDAIEMEVDASIFCSEDIEVVADEKGTSTVSVKQVGTNVSQVPLDRGNVLVAPSENTTIKTPFASIDVGAKSVVLVMVSNTGAAVFDLHDARKGSVRVTAGGESIQLSPGSHATITPHGTEKFEDVNNAEVIPHKGMSHQKLSNGLHAFRSEFSIVSAIDTVKPLKKLVNAKVKNANRISDQLVKTAAIVMQISGGADQYQHYLKPRMTASR